VTLSSSTPESETTVRGKLAKHLRLIRQAAGFTTQAPLASRLGVSPDLISKMETGKHVPTQDIFLALLDVCGVSEEMRVLLTDLWVLGRASSGGVREFFEKYATAEQKAAFLRLWGLLLIPGPLQTREYAHAMFLKGGLDEDEAAEQTELRVKRQEKVDGPDAAHVTALIYESALYRRVGTPDIMTAQLQHLLELSHRRNVLIQVVPDDGDYFPGLDGQFELATGPDISDTVIMVTVEDHVSDQSDVSGKVITLFEEVRGYALNVAQSRTAISEALQRCESQQKQQ
jgi:transcriptional regulator with XRE-family HTH domain